MTSGAGLLLDQLRPRCTFPPADTQVVCAVSGGPDSSALVALARHAGLRVDAVHVHHGLRESADHDAMTAARIATELGASFRLLHATLADGSNLEARARDERRRLLGPDAMTGHTADDQAETVVLALLRGSGATGLSAMEPGFTHPLLGLRRRETHDLCTALGLRPAVDPTNDDRRFLRNRVRSTVLPLLDDIGGRDSTPLLTRTADLLRDDDALLNELAERLDPSDAPSLAAAPLPIARRALRLWLTVDGYPPDSAAIERVLSVARCEAEACEIGGGRRISRHRQRLSLSRISS